MNICIISGASGNDVKPVIIGEAQKKFDSTLFVPLDKIRIVCRPGKTTIYYKNRDLTQFDVIWVRTFGEDFVLAEMVLDILENSGAYVQSSAEAFQICNHKFYTIKVASAIGIPVPDSAITVTPEVAAKIVKRTGFPAVVKLLSGFGGKGVMLVNSETEFRPILETLRVFDEFISTQEYVPAESTDYRALVIGNTVTGIRRKGGEGEWRANVSTGGSAQLVELSEDIRQMALSAANLLGSDVCSVDFLVTKDTQKLVEINFTPGMIVKFFGSGIAKRIIEFLYEKAEERKNGKTASGSAPSGENEESE